jgi:VCBS repeat-containing protein
MDLGGNIAFNDDGPTVVDPDSIAGVKLTVDETTLTTNASASFAGVFTETYGADGVGSVDGYALGVSIAGADSGLVDTATGNKVFLFLESGVVVGREGTDATAAATGAIVLNINVDAGLVTLDQVRAIVHSDTSNPDDSSSSMTANLITLAANVTDGDGDTANVVADIAGSFIFIDDIPVAAADTGSVGEGALLTVLAAGGVLANDASGADGWAAPDAGVVGVVAGSDANIDTDSPTTLNTSIAGTYGTLILQDDGSYTYQSTANVISGNEADTFVYTVKDGDGDLTSETLTISLSDVTGETENTTPTEQANEAGIEGGSAEGDSSNIISGELSLQSGWSVNSAQSGSTSLGDWSVAPDGAFEYTLTTATTDVDVVAETDIFTYDAQDANGNTVSNTVTITIIDDSPEAYNDNICTDSSMGNVATGNVVDGSLTAGGLADNYGADVAGQLISFEHDGTVYSATNYGAFHTITTADGGTFIFYFEDVGVNVAGNFEYTASTGTGAEVTEVFTYTLRDADGDAASANVEICVDHETLAIEDLFLSNLNYYPNPVVYSFQIKGLTRTNVELELVNILGQQLKTIPNYNGEAVSIQEFSAGIYFINLKSETGFVSIKIIKTE